MKFKNININICVLGLGYVGLPLAVSLSKFYNCLGYDIDKSKINLLNQNIDPTGEIKKKSYLKNILFTNNKEFLKKGNVFILCIPTPIYKNKKPDLSLLKNATKIVAKSISKNSIVIFESTVYPGVTEEICVPILEKYSKLKWKRDFNVGYSPERINPGDKVNKLENTCKIISGDTEESLKKIATIYSNITKIFKAKSIKVAEAAKAIENAQRDINIAFVNELTVIFSKMNLNIHSVLEAARTKWNFLDFKPGLVGGHCIGVDPYYLAFKAKSVNLKSKIILSGRQINENMTKFILSRICNYVKPPKKILFIGITFKENCSDVRNSKNLELVKMLIKKKFNVSINDHNVSNADLRKTGLSRNYKDFSNLRSNSYDAIILPFFHDYLKKIKIKKIISLLKKDAVLFDFKNAINKKQIQKYKINYQNI